MPRLPSVSVPKKFQSTHPRGVRRTDTKVFGHFQHVSIHAPAWGATGVFSTPCKRLVEVSIHAPAWGATVQLLHYHHVQVFQSTHPRGVRLNELKRLTRGTSFNPRTRVGCYHKAFCRAHGLCEFQSTHPRGVRPVHRLHPPHAPVRFNPRTRVGCDDTECWELSPAESFNPRTRVGCDPIRLQKASEIFSFNPRTRVGCDEELKGQITELQKFQSTHPRGVRLLLHRKQIDFALFQSTHPRGVRLQ